MGFLPQYIWKLILVSFHTSTYVHCLFFRAVVDECSGKIEERFICYGKTQISCGYWCLNLQKDWNGYVSISIILVVVQILILMFLRASLSQLTTHTQITHTHVDTKFLHGRDDLKVFSNPNVSMILCKFQQLQCCARAILQEQKDSPILMTV